MLSNFHTHSTFCDGKNTPEEIVEYAIQKGFHSIGFSGHGYTAFDLRYCMKDTKGYIKEINALKEKYKDDIQIYLGTEEDAFGPTNRADFDYVLGSSHYFLKDGIYYPIDSSLEYFKKCYAIFENDILKMAEAYYSNFCDYIVKRKPDIIGHFDLITKFDEIGNYGFSENHRYKDILLKYTKIALSSDSIFEVNTGGIARGFRTTPYPAEDVLFLIKKENGKIILSSDSHEISTLDYGFSEIKSYLKDFGFRVIYTMDKGSFIPIPL